ncbi:MAG: hydroxymethylbilane synthase [Bdellovibrionales bacterium]|nr:hydroxymethylbilane synthase [Bdellovibrionales bacterium]
MRLRIASRQSDLARIQAYRVAQSLKKNYSDLEIEFIFRESFGDRRLDIAMESSEEKGLFTQDFYEGLLGGEYDLVVHSWKDLPVEERKGSAVVASLPRADARDLLLLKKTTRDKCRHQALLRVLSSSPRRAHNLEDKLTLLLPGHPKIEFIPIRGNIPTRLKKLMEGNADGLIIAKAALDRLLGAPEPEFFSMQKRIHDYLEECDWCVLPLSLNPSAAAQGALAIEIASHRQDLRELLEPINCKETFELAQKERERLASYGGGCHQKIGVTILQRSYGRIEFLRGLTDEGEVLESQTLSDADLNGEWKTTENSIFPSDPKESNWFTRMKIPLSEESLLSSDGERRAVWVSRAESLPHEWENFNFRALWTSGIKSWHALARRGVWVNGCSDSMGEQEKPRLEQLIGDNLRWVKLSHLEGFEQEAVELISTYQLVPVADAPNIKGKTHFFWMSGSSFLRAQNLFPEAIAFGYHACGPGNTYRVLEKYLPSDRLKVFLSYEDWRRLTLI